MSDLDDLTIWLWLIRNGDRDLAEFLLEDISEKLLRDQLSDREKGLIFLGLRQMVDSGNAAAFFNAGKMPNISNQAQKHIDGFLAVNRHYQDNTAGVKLEIAVERAAADLDFIPKGASDEQRDAYLKQLESDYKQGREKIKKLQQKELDRMAMANALADLADSQE